MKRTFQPKTRQMKKEHGFMKRMKTRAGRNVLSLLLGRRAHRALFPTCGVVHVAGYSVVWDCDPTPEFS